MLQGDHGDHRMTDFPRLRSPRLLLRAFQHSDLTAFATYRADPHIARYQSWSSYSLADAERLYEGMQGLAFATPGCWYQIALANPDTDELLGDLALHFIDEAQVELGFTLSAAAQGKGLATEAVNTILSYLFDTLGKHRVIAVTDAQNAAAAQLLERCGFRREAHWIDNVFFKGAWGSEYQYAILAREWP
ncbi:GNAT family N-acetyltransferase [Shewanella cyperi]|uniref:GNAT family N-acetyltransferase n=1 Tax=Shewanella cyperi TaxID=2814292 RepID=UPI001D184266|nr:GNAT family protein [Shewanella cyperi]